MEKLLVLVVVVLAACDVVEPAVQAELPEQQVELSAEPVEPEPQYTTVHGVRIYNPSNRSADAARFASLADFLASGGEKRPIVLCVLR